MIRLAWVTDPHVPFLSAPAYSALCSALQEYDGVLITGDIAQSESVAEALEGLTRRTGRAIFFVLGNHDFYNAPSVDGFQKRVSTLGYLSALPPLDCGESTYLVGQDGFYDNRAGNIRASHVLLSDMHRIGEFRYLHGAELTAKIQGVADREVARAKAKIDKAVTLGATRVIFATHVAPFSGATWHQGKLSDEQWLPWMTCAAMGKMLRDQVKRNPTVTFDVYCGHTHSPGVFRESPTLNVYTGEADYGKAFLSGVVTVPQLPVLQES